MIIKQKFTEAEIEVKWYCDSIEESHRICQNIETGLEALLVDCACYTLRLRLLLLLKQFQ